MPLDLLSSTSRVETPFINVNIGGYDFGVYDKNTKNVIDEHGFSKKVIATYPNFVNGLSITKINGTVNTYQLNMDYAIRAGDDPNFLEKIFSRAAQDRIMELKYGDYSAPTFIFKKEKALMTTVTSSFNFDNSKISYNVQGTSQALSLTAGTWPFAARYAKPSDVIKEILYDKRYGMLEVFSGMQDADLVNAKGLIAVDDKKVQLEAQPNISVFQYLTYLVSCMTSITSTSDAILQGNKYILTVLDDVTGELGGPYFKIVKVARNIQEVNSLDTYTIDIGYPSPNNVVSFTIDNNETYALLYDYSQQVKQPDYSYQINDLGQIETVYVPHIGRISRFYETTEQDKTWWTKVTQYPITATLTIKGLLRPAILMSYLKVNTYFYGRKHISSGTYIITKQQDSVNASGYRTTLSLTRIAGDVIEN